MSRGDLLHHKPKYANAFQIRPRWNNKSGQRFNLGKRITNLIKDYNLVHNNDCALLSVLKSSSTKDIDLKCF